MARTGSPWREVPPDFGLWNSVYKRFARGSRAGSEAFPGKNGLIRSYWSSLSINLGILFFRKRQNFSRLFYTLTALGYSCQQALADKSLFCISGELFI
ncbi:hypothetical protein CE195_13065 [Sodalis-like symbiont of Philaenus spumarius]|nr:hypothetical protein CE195_13065 [Sodalis-like symbiont of Philaenus spumarius]